MRRVVVTGMGVVSPLGVGVDYAWQRLLNKYSGIGKLTHVDDPNINIKLAGEIPRGSACGELDASYWTEKKYRNLSEFVIYGIESSRQAIKDAGLDFKDSKLSERTGLYMGSGIGGIANIEKSVIEAIDKGYNRISPFFITKNLVNLLNGNLSLIFNIKGPSIAMSTACATGLHSVITATNAIKLGLIDVAVAGASEFPFAKVGVAGFNAMRALSRGSKSTDSRPWDRDRNGFVMAEGAGTLILEDYEFARKRGAKIYAQIAGSGMSSDAFHIAKPEQNGHGAYASMNNALKMAEISADKIDYINAHATSTPLGDIAEILAINKKFNNLKLPISSNKGAIGHLLGAASAVESIFAIMSLRQNICPLTLNLTHIDEKIKGNNLVKKDNQERKLNYVLKNSFAFGGTNASIIFKKM